jgi:hypothetical protein
MGTFSENLRAFVAKAKGNEELVLRKVVLQLEISLVMKSPVDTGRFRANWQIGYDQVNASTDAAPDPTGEAAIARAQAALQGIQVGGIVYLTNSLPYARPLEYGHSKQAPTGMVRETVVEFGRYLEQAVGAVK